MFTQRRFVLSFHKSSSVFIEAYSFMLMTHLKNRSLHTLASTAYLLKLSHCPSNILPIFIVLLTAVTSRVFFTCCHALKTPRTKKKNSSLHYQTKFVENTHSDPHVTTIRLLALFTFQYCRQSCSFQYCRQSCSCSIHYERDGD